MRLRAIAVAGVLAVLALPVSSGAQTLGMSITSVGANYTNGSWSMGYRFNVLNPITVTALGFYDDNQDGLSESHEVGLWDFSGNLLASTTVAAGSGGQLVNFFRLSAVAPTVLAVGNGYRVAAVTGRENYAYGNFHTSAPDIQYAGYNYCGTSATLQNPSSGCGGGEWFGDPNDGGIHGGNIAYSNVVATPEPASMLLLGTGLLGVFGVARRRRSSP